MYFNRMNVDLSVTLCPVQAFDSVSLPITILKRAWYSWCLGISKPNIDNKTCCKGTFNVCVTCSFLTSPFPTSGSPPYGSQNTGRTSPPSSPPPYSARGWCITECAWRVFRYLPPEAASWSDGKMPEWISYSRLSKGSFSFPDPFWEGSPVCCFLWMPTRGAWCWMPLSPSTKSSCLHSFPRLGRIRSPGRVQLVSACLPGCKRKYCFNYWMDLVSPVVYAVFLKLTLLHSPSEGGEGKWLHGNFKGRAVIKQEDVLCERSSGFWGWW